MSRKPTAEEIGTLNIEQAARWGRPPPKAVGGIGGELYIVHVHATREVPEPEPVDVAEVNGRASLEWEEPLIVAARERERAREWRP